MKKLLGLFLLTLCLTVHSQDIEAAGIVGLNYTTYYYNGGGSPSVANLTPVTSGVTSTVNFNWGSGAVMGLRGDAVIIHFTGYFKADNAGTYYIGTSSDDGSTLTVNGVSLVNCWCDQGPTFRYGAINLEAGQVVPIDMWYYENGGGAVMQLYWYTASGWQIVPSTMLATESTYWAPPALAWGASSSSFSISATNQAKLNAFNNRGTADSQVHIEQIGNSNTITVEQTGSENNYVNYVGNGGFNNVNIKQNANNSSQKNYVELSVTGNSNNVDIKQRTANETTAFTKSVFASVNGDNNSLIIDQKNSGSHYASVTLNGGNKSVSLTQQGSANHMADITLSGTQSSGINLTQQGSTQQFYSINHTCSTSGGCGTITVTQGQ